MSSEQRNPGFYWVVKEGGIEEVAEYLNGWFVTGFEDEFDDAYFLEIDERRIERPVDGGDDL